MMSQGGEVLEQSLTENRLEKLRETWLFAKNNSRYYGSILPELSPSAISLDDLRRVPILTKDDLASHRDQLRCQRGLPAYMVFTGGTTGQPRVIYGTEEDLTGGGGPDDVPGGGNLSLGMTTGQGHHGYVPLVPGRLALIQLPLNNRKNYEWAWHMLANEHQFEGYDSKVSHLVLPLPALKKLLHFFLEQEYDLSRLSLSLAKTFAWYLSTRWRDFIQTTLDVLVVDSFGFTEIPAVARQCFTCGWYHYGPEAIWEVVDSWTDELLEDGVGRLLVTSLYPHARDQILFRYDPGDLVELGPFCQTVGEQGFKPCGHSTDACSIREGDKWSWIAWPSQFQEAVDFLPDIGRLEERRFSGVTSTPDDGFAKWRLRKVSDDAPVIELEVEMKFSPSLYRQRWESCREEIRSTILKNSQELARRISSGQVSLKVTGLPPGSIADEEVFVC